MRFRRLPIGAAAIIAASIALVAPASGGPTPLIDVTDDEFTPEEMTIVVANGGVAWGWNALNDHQHNVVQDRKLFNSGPPVLTRPAYELDPSAGTFPYYCSLHGNPGGLGMSGTVKVAPAAGPFRRARRGDIVIPIRWASDSTETGDQFDVQYKVDDGKWKDWRKNTSKKTGSFGENGKPVRVRPGKTYRIRARSEKSSNPKKKRSGWSPALVVGLN
jgi:plastocyanin